MFKKNSDDRYEYLFSLREVGSDQWFKTYEKELARPSITPAWRESKHPSQLLKRIYKLENMIEDAIQQGLMFDVSEEY